MFEHARATAMIPAQDVERARRWYEEKLGILADEIADYGVRYELNGVHAFLYPTPGAGTARHTLLSFNTTDLLGDMAKMRARGVVFEEYDLPELKTENGVASWGEVKNAWCRDSEGNILGFVQGMYPPVGVARQAGRAYVPAVRVFLDFEASSLGDDSYPIEVGWVFEDGRGEAHLIRPLDGWIDWDPEAEGLHGLSRQKLLFEGEAVEAVAGRLVDELGGHALFASAPSWDGHWLSLLLRAGGFPRHLLRLRDTDEVFVEAARARLGEGAAAASVAALVEGVRTAAKGWPVTHRALGDAEREWRIVRAIMG